MRKQKQLRLVGHFIEVNGELVEIDPYQTDLPDRCKLAVAEMFTGLKHELIEPEPELILPN